MKFILTGMNGTVAPALAHRLRNDRHHITAWNRNQIPIDNPVACDAFICEQKPDWVIHMAMGSPDWAAGMAQVCHREGINFMFTGSVSAFDGGKTGPFPCDHVLDATDDYGKYKAECERKVMAANPNAFIARLGWQIGDAPGSNNMIDFLTRNQAEKGKIEASTGWIPSCAFLTDTVEAMNSIIMKFPPGIYQLEGNPGLNFYQIVIGLNALHGNKWLVVKKDEPARDNRMLEERIKMTMLDTRISPR